METKEKNINSFDNLSLLTPTQLQEKIQNGELTVDCEFSEKEQTKISNLAKQIDINNRSSLVFYGAGAQDRVSKFANIALSQYDVAKLDEAGEVLKNLVNILKTYNPTLENKQQISIIGFFCKKKQNVEITLETAKASFSSINNNINDTEKLLIEEYYNPLAHEIANFEETHSILIDIYHELSMYIAAGQKRIDYAQNVELPELNRKVTKAESKLDEQILQDFEKAINSFKENLHCLEISRQLCLFNASSLRLLQENYIKVVTQIKQFIRLSLPEWRMQMRILLGLQDVDKYQNNMNEVRDFTNNLFLNSREQLKDLSIKSESNTNKSIEAIATSVEVNKSYIDTLNLALKTYRQNMAEVHKGWKINHEIEEKRNEVLSNYTSNITNDSLEHDSMRESIVVEDETHTEANKKYTLD